MARRYPSNSTAQQGADLGDIVSARMIDSVLGSVFGSMDPKAQQQQDQFEAQQQRAASQFDQTMALQQRQFDSLDSQRRLLQVQQEHNEKLDSLKPDAYKAILQFNPKRTDADAALIDFGTTYGSVLDRDPELRSQFGKAKERADEFTKAREAFKDKYGTDYSRITDEATGVEYFDTAAGNLIARRHGVAPTLDDAVAKAVITPEEAGMMKTWVGTASADALPVEGTQAWLASKQGAKVATDAQKKETSDKIKELNAVAGRAHDDYRTLSNSPTATEEQKAEARDRVVAVNNEISRLSGVDVEKVTKQRNDDALRKEWADLSARDGKEVWNAAKSKEWTVSDQKDSVLKRMLDAGLAKTFNSPEEITAGLTDLNDDDVVSVNWAGKQVPMSGAEYKRRIKKTPDAAPASTPQTPGSPAQDATAAAAQPVKDLETMTSEELQALRDDIEKKKAKEFQQQALKASEAKAAYIKELDAKEAAAKAEELKRQEAENARADQYKRERLIAEIRKSRGEENQN